jgi:hypothetical protein
MHVSKETITALSVTQIPACMLPVMDPLETAQIVLALRQLVITVLLLHQHSKYALRIITAQGGQRCPLHARLAKKGPLGCPLLLDVISHASHLQANTAKTSNPMYT